MKLKKIVAPIYNKFGINNRRTKKIARHVGLSFIFKSGSVVANFLLVPLTINYLDTEKYGIWLTLSSFIAWFSFFDVGLGNGLRNKFAEAKAKGDQQLAKAYVSSAYFSIGSVSVILMIAFLSLNSLIDWSVVFNTDSSLQEELNILMPVVFSFFCLQLVVKLITTIYIADQHHSIQDTVQFFTQSGSLIVIWLLTKTSESSLLIFGTIFSALPVILLLLLNLYSFSKIYKTVKPSFSLWKKEYLKDIFGIGFSFFIIQIAALVLFSTDNFIISKLFGPAEVVPYNISYKYFSIAIMLYSILIGPYWSSFTEAYIKKDYVWIKNSVNNVMKIWIMIPVLLIAMVLFADNFYQWWVGDAVVVSLLLNISMALFAMLITFNMIYVNFINGAGKIRLQLITSLITMAINIPLSIYFGKYLGLGASGVILATCFCLGYSVVLRPIQFYKLINNTAKGIWSK